MHFKCHKTLNEVKSHKHGKLFSNDYCLNFFNENVLLIDITRNISMLRYTTGLPHTTHYK